MANIYSTLYTALVGLGYTVREQGTFTDTDTLPATFVTYQMIYKNDVAHSDNAPSSNIARVQATLYSTDPAIKQGADAALWAVLKPAGFLRVGGRDLPFDPSTGHYAYTCDFRLYQEEV